MSDMEEGGSSATRARKHGPVVEIRPLREEDVLQLQLQLPPPHPGIYGARLEQQTRGEGVSLVAWRDARPVGHVFVNRVPGEPLGSLLPGAPAIEQLEVHPGQRSRGLGSRLLKAGEELLRREGYTRVVLGVGVDNHAASALYERRGYRDAGLAPAIDVTPVLEPDGVEHLRPELVRVLVKALD